MACDFCAPSDTARGYRPQHYCGACDRFCLGIYDAPCLQATLEEPTIQVRVWLEVLMQTPHSGSLGVLMEGRQPRARHRGFFTPIPNPGPVEKGKENAKYQPTVADIVRAYDRYAREGADIADQQVAQLRGHEGKRLVPLPVAAKARVGYGTRGERMNAAIQMGYLSPLGVRYELEWFHIGTIVAASMHCYPDGAAGGLIG